MRFKKDADFGKFFEKIKECREDVLFYTLEGDQLNLSSTISRFIFSSVNFHEGIVGSGKVVCKCKEDEELLKDFFEKG